MININIQELNERGYEYLKEIFELPEYFGNNLDGLYDCLTDRSSLTVVYENYLEVNEDSKRIVDIINKAIHDLYLEEEE